MPYAPKAHSPRRSTAKPLPRRDTRASASERGYDSNWLKLRKWYVAREPLCEDCNALGRVEPVHEVDHVIPITGPDDPLRLDAENLRSRCRSHHSQKTARWDDEIREFFGRHGKAETLRRYRDVMVENFQKNHGTPAGGIAL